ncbi:MAG: pyridoxamine 5'-phosphate oxidase family protein [Desulforhopalus sp.]|nr:pyridoxamine 5'-phosphate oxidase family protein [Desulforhopalus sp.]
MLNEIVREAIKKIDAFSMTTMNGEQMYSRIVSVCGSDEENIYFLTMNVKPFYRQLAADHRISICGIYPHGYTTSNNEVGQPHWDPGFTLRVTGEVREIPEQEVREKAAAGSAVH